MIAMLVANWTRPSTSIRPARCRRLEAPLGADEYEFYVPDSYRLKPNLTINYGLRYSLFSPPWETNGTQVTPTSRPGRLVSAARRRDPDRRRV